MTRRRKTYGVLDGISVVSVKRRGVIIDKLGAKLQESPIGKEVAFAFCLHAQTDT